MKLLWLTRGHKTLGAKWLFEPWFSHQQSLCLDNELAPKPQRFIPPNVVRQLKKSPRTNGTFGFCRHTKPTLKKPKEPFFCQRSDRITCKKSILTDRKERNRVNGDKQTETKKGTQQSLPESKTQQDRN